MTEKGRAEPASNIENRLRSLRTAKGLSPAELGSMAGITRQAIYAIESNQYLPTTAVALRLSAALGCRVEDLFNLVSNREVIEGELLGVPPEESRARVKVARVGPRLVVRLVADLGDVLSYAIPADGLMLEPPGERRKRRGSSVRVELLRDRRQIDDQLLVAGCDPTVFLVGDHLRRRDGTAGVVAWTMGSSAALQAVKRGEVHMAGIHIQDPRSGEWNLPYLRRHLNLDQVTVVTFAGWEQGLILKPGNPKGIRSVADMVRKDIQLVNREEGAGARLLLDRLLNGAGLRPDRIKGYDRLGRSHVEVARMVAEGIADVGLGVRSAARLYRLNFVPLQDERYDLVIPNEHLKSHPSISTFLDAIVSRPFRTEVEALGGYDTSQTGRVQELSSKR